MVETEQRDTDVVTSPELRSGPTVIVDGVHITYRVLKGQRPTLRRLISRRFKPQPYPEAELRAAVHRLAQFLPKA